MIRITIFREKIQLINDEGDYDTFEDEVLNKKVKSYDQLLRELSSLGKKYDWEDWDTAGTGLDPEVSWVDHTPIYSMGSHDSYATVRYRLHLDPERPYELTPSQIDQVEYALGMKSGHLYDIPEEPVYKVLTYKYNLERYAGDVNQAMKMSNTVERHVRTKLKLNHDPLLFRSFKGAFNRVAIFVLPDDYSTSIPKRTRVTLSRHLRKYITLEVSEMTHTALNKHLVRHGGRKLTKAIRMASSEIKLSDVKRAFSDLADIEYQNEEGHMVYLNPRQVTIILQDILEIAKKNQDSHKDFMSDMDLYSDVWFSTRSYGPSHNAQDKFFDMYEDFASVFIER